MKINYSLRYLWRNRGNSVTRLVSLALGLIVALLICSYVGINLSYGRFFPDRERVYQVFMKSSMADFSSQGMLEPMAFTLAEEVPSIEMTTNLLKESVQVNMGNDAIKSRRLKVSSDFFKVLDFGVISGDVERVLSNEGLANNEVMISERLSDKVFGKNDPLGKIITINEEEHVVAGVFNTPPVTNPIVDFDIVSWLKFDPQTLDWNGGDNYPTYIKLNKGATIDELETQFESLIEHHEMLQFMMHMLHVEFFFVPIEDSYYVVDDSTRTTQVIYGVLAVLALLVGTLNYVLLTLSSLASRSRTIAMLRCSGASRGDIFRMLLSETFIMIVASILLAAFLLLCLSNQIYQLLGYHLNELFALERIWIPALVCIVSFLLAGLIPAVLYSRVNLEYAFKRGSDNRTWWKRILLFVQVACTTAVVCFLLVTAQQSKYVLKADVGYKYDNVITMEYSATQSQHSALRDEIGKLPFVQSVGLSVQYPINGYMGSPVIDVEKEEIMFLCRYECFDENYIETMQMEIIRGRNFNEQDGTKKAIVNEKFVHQHGWDLNSAVGKYFFQNGGWVQVIGVIKDFSQGLGIILPLAVYRPEHFFNQMSAQDAMLQYNIRLDELSSENIKALDNAIKKHYHSDSEYTLLSYADKVKSQFTYRDDMRNNVLVISLVTLLISLIGLVGYLGNEMSRRRKEIAIRKVNGATSVQVLSLLGLNLLWVIVPAIITGVVGAVWGGLRYIDMLETMCEPLASWTFILGAGIVLLIIYVILVVRTWKTANSNPIEMIKIE